MADAPTVMLREKVYDYLLERSSNYDGGYIAPHELTQDGIGECFGLKRANISLVLKQLLREGRIRWYLARIRMPDGTDYPVRRRVYAVVEGGKVDGTQVGLETLADHVMHTYGSDGATRLVGILERRI